MSDTHPKPRFRTLTIVTFFMGVVLLCLSITIIAIPELLHFDTAFADGTHTRHIVYGTFFLISGVLFCGFSVRSYDRHNATFSPPHPTTTSTGDNPTPPSKKKPQSTMRPHWWNYLRNGKNHKKFTEKTATTADNNHYRDGYGKTNEKHPLSVTHDNHTPTDQQQLAHHLGGEISPDGRIIHLSRATIDQQLTDTLTHGCAWLQADTLSEAIFSTAVLIPTRTELLTYLNSHFPDHTIIISDHLKKNCGLPYFVSHGVRLHCAMLNRPADVHHMLSHYDPSLPLACVLVSGSMNLDSRTSEENQLATIRHSLMGLLCWHHECQQFLVITGQ